MCFDHHNSSLNHTWRHCIPGAEELFGLTRYVLIREYLSPWSWSRWSPFLCIFIGFSKKSSCDVKLLQITNLDFKNRGLSYRNQKNTCYQNILQSHCHEDINFSSISLVTLADKPFQMFICTHLCLQTDWLPL
jgi:hypothetical protein